MSHIEICHLTKDNKSRFIDVLVRELHIKFGTDLPENYGYAMPWSLLSLIESEKIDSYQLLYKNGNFWVGSGGIIRHTHNGLLYQAAFRAFTAKKNGLEYKSYTHEYNTKLQIQRAILNNCTKVVLSFNEYNEKLFNLTHSYFLPKSFKSSKYTVSESPVEFNGVPQWTITLDVQSLIANEEFIILNTYKETYV